MRGSNQRSGELFSYVDLEKRVRLDHPLRAIRVLTDSALEALSGDFAALYSGLGRPSIAPEMLLRAMLLQAFYSVRSERQLMERLEFDLLFRWFVGLGMDDPVWDHSTFSKNRDRLDRKSTRLNSSHVEISYAVFCLKKKKKNKKQDQVKTTKKIKEKNEQTTETT